MNKVWLNLRKHAACLAVLLCLAGLLAACEQADKARTSNFASPWLISEPKVQASQSSLPAATEASSIAAATQPTSNETVTDVEPQITQAISEQGKDSPHKLEPAATEPKPVAKTVEPSASVRTTELSDTEQAELNQVNQTVESSEDKAAKLDHLAKRKLLRLQRLPAVEQDLRHLINEERDKVGLAAYFDNPSLTLQLETQLVYNLHYLFPKHFVTGPASALIMALHSEKALSNGVLSSHFAREISENEANRIALIGDGMDQLSLLVLYCLREGDTSQHHYLLAAQPWKASWSSELSLQKPEPEVAGHLLAPQPTNPAEPAAAADDDASESRLANQPESKQKLPDEPAKASQAEGE